MKYSQSDKSNSTISSRLSRIAGITFLLFGTLHASAQNDTLNDTKAPSTVIIADTTINAGKGKGGSQPADPNPPNMLKNKSNPAAKTTQPVKDEPQDTLAKAPKPHSPKRAATYSALLPGLGQAYNRKYWKMPIIYAGFAGLGYAVYFTNDNYQEFRKAYGVRLDTDSLNDTHPLYSNSDLKITRDYWHRNRDLSVVGCLALYALQVIDAAVDGHLYKFDDRINDKLSIQLEPRPYMGAFNRAPVHGLRLTVKF